MVYVVSDDEGTIHLPFFSSAYSSAPRNSIQDSIVAFLGRNTKLSFSAVGGFCAMLEGEISLVIDCHKNIAVVFSAGCGGGFGTSVGVGATLNQGVIDARKMDNLDARIGASLFFVGFELDDDQKYSASIWKPKMGGDFHATINRTWVIILWEGENENNSN